VRRPRAPEYAERLPNLTAVRHPPKFADDQNPPKPGGAPSLPKSVEIGLNLKAG
jgi:hypothetical protein